MTSPVTTPSGRRRPPVAPAASATGSTGSTQGDTAVAAPATNANRTRSVTPPRMAPAKPSIAPTRGGARAGAWEVAPARAAPRLHWGDRRERSCRGTQLECARQSGGAHGEVGVEASARELVHDLRRHRAEGHGHG